MNENFPQNQASSEGSSEQELNDAKVKSAITALGGKAFSAYIDVFKIQGVGTQELFLEDIERFNNLPAEMRGKGNYDANRTLDERVELSTIQKTPAGYELIVTLQKDGTLVLSTNLTA